MILEELEVMNYRSASSVVLPIKSINGGYTYSLLGINESGKSSILKGISLYETTTPKYPEDYFDEDDVTGVTLKYKVSENDLDRLRKKLIDEFGFPKEIATLVNITKVEIQAYFEPEVDAEREFYESIDLKTDIIEGYTLSEGKLTKIAKEDIVSEPLKLSTFFNKFLPKYFWSISHDVIFWESSDQYLINENIDLNSFASAPDEVSIPLTNCFKLSGIEQTKIKKTIEKLNAAAPIRNLESKLSRIVTNHIKEVWPEHKVKITFEINEGKLSLLVEDEGVMDKAKTTIQRSDGFRQFISFLLSLSTERINQKMRPTIMLLDEPEVHLHPQAQINLMNELIKISQSTEHIVLYATHSNYMIDKKNLNRNYTVTKKKNETTVISQIPSASSSYSEINYTVFNIATNDYHNELYGYLEDIMPTKLNGLPATKEWINEKSGKTQMVSSSKYIRNSIHHPENTSNRSFTYKQLVNSIDTMRKLKYT